MDTIKYIKIKAAGFIAYSDAFIARNTGIDLHAYMLDLIGTPSSVKALSAILHSGECCHISNPNETVQEIEFFRSVKTRELLFPGSLRSYRTRKTGSIVNKVLINTNCFTCSHESLSAVVYGPDMPTIIDRAFLSLDASTTVPLKQEWRCWLWDEILQPEKLCSFGDEELQQAYYIGWPDDDIIRKRIREAAIAKYLH